MKRLPYKIKKVSFSLTKNGPTSIEVKIYPRRRKSSRRKKIKMARTPWPLPWKPLCHRKTLLAYDIA